MKDIPNYIVIFAFWTGRVLKIKLSKEEKKHEARCDDFEEIVDKFSEKYRFSFSNCQWMGLKE